MRPLLLLVLFWALSPALRSQPSGDPLALDHKFSIGFGPMDLVWDLPRGRCYALDAIGHRIVTFRLSDGSVEAEFPVALAPERGFLRPDGRRLYVTLPHRTHDNYWFDPHTGTIVEINLEEETARSFDIDRDPYDLVATDDGWLVVSDGSGQWTSVSSYSSDTGAKISQFSIRQLSTLALHPNQRQIYSADTDISPSNIHSWTLDPATGMLGAGVPSPYWGDYSFGGAVTVDPSGEWLVARGGALFRSSTDPELDMLFQGSLAGGTVERVAFSGSGRVAFTIGSLPPQSAPRVSCYGPAFDFLGSWSSDLPPSRVAVSSDRLYLLVGGEVRVFVNPAAGAETNQPPVPEFSWNPTEPNTTQTITLDAGLSTDDQDPALPLFYRWDLDGDGVFEGELRTNTLQEVRFTVDGEHLVGLEVRDAWGIRSRTNRTLVVSRADDPGLLPPPHSAFHLPGMVTEAVWDIQRQRVYALDSAQARMLTVDLRSGLAIRQHVFQHEPSCAAMTADGLWLYVALLSEPANGNNPGNSLIAEFDLARGVKTREFRVLVNPVDLEVTRDRVLVVYGTSSGKVELRTFDGVTGRQVGSAPVDWFTRGGGLALDPGERFVLLCPAGLNRVANFELQLPSGELIARLDRSLDLPASVNVPVALDPTGTRLATANGLIIEIEQPGGIVIGLQRELTSPGHAISALKFDDQSRPVALGLLGSKVAAWLLDNGFQFASLEAPPASLYLGVDASNVYTLAPTNNQTLLTRLPNPGAGIETNRPPRAHFEILPNPPNTSMPATLDASTSTDDGTGGRPLSFRWDWDGDGVYDTAPSFDPVVTHRFRESGPRTVRLAAYDAYGSVAYSEQSVVVTAQVDPGEPGPAHPPFILPFTAGDVAFDSARNHMFATDYSGKAIVQVDLATGLITRRWRLEAAPIRLSLRPDGRRLYATLSAYVPFYPAPLSEPQKGWLAEFDLEQGGLMRLIRTDVVPLDVAATDDGWLLVSSDYGGGSSIDLHRADTGERVDRSDQAFQGYDLLLDSTQDGVYAADRGLSPSKVMRVRLDRSAGKIAGIDLFPYHGQHLVEGKVFLLPGGKEIMARSLSIFTASTLEFTRELPWMTYIDDVVPVPGSGLLAMVSRGQLFYATAGTLALTSTLPINDGRHWLGAGSDAHFLVETYDWSDAPTVTVLQRRTAPAPDAASNHPPTVWLRDPPYGTLHTPGTTLSFEAAAADEDGSVAGVFFRLDDTELVTLPSVPPWRFWTPPTGLAAGTHVLSVVATDNLGATSSVASVTLQITEQPRVQWLQPKPPLLLETPAPVVLEVAAQDPDGEVARVEFTALDGTNSIALGTVTAAPWRLEVPELAKSSALRAVAYDNLGMTSPDTDTPVHFLGAVGDDYYRPFTLEGTNTVASASNTTATWQEGEYVPMGPDSWAAHSIWWRWTAPVSGTVVIDTEGSEFDTLLEADTLSSAGRLVLVAANDDSLDAPPWSRIKFSVTAGTAYLIRVDGYAGATGMVHLNLSYSVIMPPAPPNDDFSARIVMTGDSWVTTGSNRGATAQSGERGALNLVGGSSVWWEWKAPTNGFVTVTTLGSSFDTILTLFVGGPGVTVANLSPTAGNDDDPTGGVTSRLRVYTPVGRNFYIRVEGLRGAQGDIRLALDWQASVIGQRPPNDDFAAADWIVGEEAILAASLTTATHETGESTPSPSLWWRWIAPHTGPVTLTTSSPSIQELGVFTGDTLPTLTAPPSSSVERTGSKPLVVTFESVRGQTYRFRAATPWTQADFTLHLDSKASGMTGRLAPIASPVAGLRLLQYDGAAAHTTVIESAAILGQWSPMSTNVVAPGDAFVLPEENRTNAFYRLRLVD